MSGRKSTLTLLTSDAGGKTAPDGLEGDHEVEVGALEAFVEGEHPEADRLLIDVRGAAESTVSELGRVLDVRPIDRPIIVLASEDQREAALEALEGGVDDVLLDSAVSADAVRWAFRRATARRRGLLRSRRRERAVRSLIGQLPGIVWTTDEKLRFTSAQGLDLAGIGRLPEEGLDLDHEEFFGTADGRAGSLEAHRRALRGEPTEFELELGGRQFRAFVRPFAGVDGNPIGTVGLGVDITERVRLEEALRISRDRFESVVENLVDAFGLYEAIRAEDGTIEDFRVRYVNPEAARINGVPAERQIDSRLLEVVPALERTGLIDRYREVVETGGPVRLESYSHADPDAEAPLTGEFDITAFKVGDGFAAIWREVSERARQAEELRRSRERLRTVVETAPVILFVVDRDGTFVFSEGGALPRLGLEPGEVVGQSAYDLYGDIDGIGADLDAALSGEEVMTTITIGGATFETSYTPWRGEDGELLGSVGVAIDRTAEARADRARAETEDRYRALMEQTEDFLTVTDRAGVVQYASESVRRVLGYEPEELVGGRSEELVHPEDLAEFKAGMSEVMVDPDHVHTTVVRLRDGEGEWRVIESRVRNLLDHPSIRGVLSTSRDVTERYDLEAQLHQAQKMEAVGRLAGGVAHDFNNLLTVLKGNAQLLLALDRLDAEAEELVDEIETTADRGSALTRQLLTFSRQERRTAEPLDLSVEVEENLTLARRLVEENIEILTDLEDDVPVMADPGRLGQVLMNLVVNARDAMPTGGQLRLETRTVELKQGLETSHDDVGPGRYAVLSVADTGIGMSPDVQRRVFDPFFSTKPTGQGTGLGLSTVWGIVHQAGGLVHVYSEVGQGTAFRIYLPLLEADAPPKAEPEKTEAPARPTKSARILLVEDDPAVRRLVCRLLGNGGHEVVEAARAEEALQRIEELEEPIDLLVTDVVMPGLSGPELAERLLADRPGLRVIFTSGYSEDELRRRKQIVERARFVEKPFETSAFMRVVDEALEDL